MTYEFVRNFAGTWGLIYLVVVFLGVIAFVLRPSMGKHAEEAANIPFNEDHSEGDISK